MKVPRRLRIALILEQSLGHVTHADNLRTILQSTDEVELDFRDIPYDVSGWAARLPLYGSNWTVRAGIRARRAIRAAAAAGPLDAVFIHTQVPAVLTGRWMRRFPTVVSLDATPLQYDSLGEHYRHEQGSDRVERLKWKANRACFARAARIVSWSDWGKEGLVADYEVPAAKVEVIPPGVFLSRWHPPSDDRPTSDTVRILFVGADLDRKGGTTLIEAVRQLRADGSPVELHLVTRSPVPDTDGVVVHPAMTPNSAALVELYQRSDIFCLPTRGDCLPMVLSEAGATGLPLVSTDVGAIGEIVREGHSGLLVPVDDLARLTAALGSLVDDADGRRRLGAQAAALVASTFDAERNARRLLDLLIDVARSSERGDR